MNIELKPIKNNKTYEQFMQWVDLQFEKNVKPNTPQGEKLQVALLLIKQYEDKYFAIPIPEAIDAVKVKMQEKGLRSKDLVGMIGTKSYVSSLLNKRKPMTLQIAKIFHKQLGIPAEILLA
jgi:HTH-type transcriptional regulator / antitoxin HigA